MPTEPTNIAIIGSYAVALVMDVDRIPVEGETVLGRNFRETWGGKGSDMAVQAARLGAETSFIGVVGDDTYGADFVELMENEGVHIDGLRRTDETRTGAGFIMKDDKGHNIISVANGANEDSSPEDIDRNEDVIQNADVALTQLEIPVETALHGLKVAKEAGGTTILNPAPAVDFSEQDLSDVDYLTPNESEARVCAGYDADHEIDDRDVARELINSGCGTVVITRGDQGCYLYDENQSIQVDAYPVDVVDSNGAGDAFNAGLAVALGEDMDIKKALRFATATGGLSCTDWETINSYHDRDEVEALINEVNP